MAGDVDTNVILSRCMWLQTQNLHIERLTLTIVEEKLIVAEQELEVSQDIWFVMRKLKRSETDPVVRHATRERWKVAKNVVQKIKDKLEGNIPFDAEDVPGDNDPPSSPNHAALSMKIVIPARRINHEQESPSAPRTQPNPDADKATEEIDNNEQENPSAPRTQPSPDADKATEEIDDIEQLKDHAPKIPDDPLSNLEFAQSAIQPSKINAVEPNGRIDRETRETPVDQSASVDVQQASNEQLPTATDSDSSANPEGSQGTQERLGINAMEIDKTPDDNLATLYASQVVQQLLEITSMEVDVRVDQQQREATVSKVVAVPENHPMEIDSTIYRASDENSMEIDSMEVDELRSKALTINASEEQQASMSAGDDTPTEQVSALRREHVIKTADWVFPTVEAITQSLNKAQEMAMKATIESHPEVVEVKPPNIAILDQPGLLMMEDDPVLPDYIDPKLQAGKASGSAAVQLSHGAQDVRADGDMQVDVPASDPPKAAPASLPEIADKNLADPGSGNANGSEPAITKTAVTRNIDLDPSACLPQHVLAAIPKQVLEAIEEAQQHRSLNLETITKLESDLCSPKQRTMTEIREQLREIDRGYTVVDANERRLHQLWDQIEAIQKTADQEERRKPLAAKYRKLTNTIKALKDSLETVSNERSDAVKAEIARQRKEREEVKAALVAMDLGDVEEPAKAEEVAAPIAQVLQPNEQQEEDSEQEDSEQEDSEQEEATDGESKPKKKGKPSSEESSQKRAEAKERKRVMTAAAISKIRARLAGRSLDYPLYGAEEDVRKSMEKLAGMNKQQKIQLQRACAKSVTKFLKTGELSDLTPRTRKALVNLDSLMPHESLATKELVIALHTNTKLNTQCRFHKDQTKTKIYDGCATNIVEGVGFKATYNKTKEDGVQPEEPGFMHCGCTIEDMLIDFFLFKTMKAAARAPSLRGWTEGMKADGFSPRQRAFVVDIFKFWTQLDADDLYSVSLERGAELKELDLRLISIRKLIAYWREKTGIPIELKFPENMPAIMPKAETK